MSAFLCPPCDQQGPASVVSGLLQPIELPHDVSLSAQRMPRSP